MDLLVRAAAIYEDPQVLRGERPAGGYGGGLERSRVRAEPVKLVIPDSAVMNLYRQPRSSRDQAASRGVFPAARESPDDITRSRHAIASMLESLMPKRGVTDRVDEGGLQWAAEQLPW
jgi:hypothetical protein